VRPKPAVELCTAMKSLLMLALFFTSAFANARAAVMQLDCPVRPTYCNTRELCTDFDDKLVIDMSRHVADVHIQSQGQDVFNVQRYALTVSKTEMKFGGWTLNRSTLQVSDSVNENGTLEYIYNGQCTQSL
jgi:hypothetical protein